MRSISSAVIAGSMYQAVGSARPRSRSSLSARSSVSTNVMQASFRAAVVSVTLRLMWAGESRPASPNVDTEDGVQEAVLLAWLNLRSLARAEHDGLASGAT